MSSILSCAPRFPALVLTLMIGGTLLTPLARMAATAQTISFSGVTEAGFVYLAAGSATTHLAVTATPGVFTGTTSVVFVLEYQGAVLVNRTSPPPYSTTFTNLSAGKYFLSAKLNASSGVPSGDVSFDIAPTLPIPANDHWTNAALIPGGGAMVFATNHYATAEAGEPMHGGAAAGRSVWWKWTASSAGVLTATTRGSGLDTVLAVYTGTNLATLLPVAANHDAGWGTNTFSQVTFTTVAGREYFFAVDSAVGAGGIIPTGTLQLQLLAAAAPTLMVTTPPDGNVFPVPVDGARTNFSLLAQITDLAGIAEVRYWFDGNGESEQGVLLPPYALTRTNLATGDYWFSLMAVNNLGLVNVSHYGFAVTPVGAKLLFTDFPALTTNGFRFAFTGRRGGNYQLQSSTNLDVWCSVTGFTNFPGVVKITDPTVTNVNSRFYRAVAQ